MKQLNTSYPITKIWLLKIQHLFLRNSFFFFAFFSVLVHFFCFVPHFTYPNQISNLEIRFQTLIISKIGRTTFTCPSSMLQWSGLTKTFKFYPSNQAPSPSQFPWLHLLWSKTFACPIKLLCQGCCYIFCSAKKPRKKHSHQPNFLQRNKRMATSTTSSSAISSACLSKPSQDNHLAHQRTSQIHCLCCLVISPSKFIFLKAFSCYLTVLSLRSSLLTLSLSGASARNMAPSNCTVHLSWWIVSTSYGLMTRWKVTSTSLQN